MVLCRVSEIWISQTEVLSRAHLVVCLTVDLSNYWTFPACIRTRLKNAPVNQTSHTDDQSILSNPQHNTPLPLHVSHHLSSIVCDSFRRRVVPVDFSASAAVFCPGRRPSHRAGSFRGWPAGTRCEGSAVEGSVISIVIRSPSDLVLP